jgi:hypothetical protein
LLDLLDLLDFVAFVFCLPVNIALGTISPNINTNVTDNIIAI